MKNIKNPEINNEVAFPSYYPEYDGEWKLMQFDDSKVVNRNYVQMFRDCVSTLAGMSSCANDLIKWIASYEMDSDNKFHNTLGVRNKFSKHVGNIYGDSSIRKAVAELTRRGALLYIQKPDYYANPLYYWKGEKDKYLEAIRLFLEFNGKREAVLMVSKKTNGKWYDASIDVDNLKSNFDKGKAQEKQIKKAQKGKKERLLNGEESKIVPFNGYGTFEMGDKISVNGSKVTICKVEGDYVFWVSDTGLQSIHKQYVIVTK